jgi:hypothetical protein
MTRGVIQDDRWLEQPIERHEPRNELEQPGKRPWGKFEMGREPGPDQPRQPAQQNAATLLASACQDRLNNAFGFLGMERGFAWSSK